MIKGIKNYVILNLRPVLPTHYNLLLRDKKLPLIDKIKIMDNPRTMRHWNVLIHATGSQLNHREKFAINATEHLKLYDPSGKTEGCGCTLCVLQHRKYLLTRDLNNIKILVQTKKEYIGKKTQKLIEQKQRSITEELLATNRGITDLSTLCNLPVRNKNHSISQLRKSELQALKLKQAREKLFKLSYSQKTRYDQLLKMNLVQDLIPLYVGLGLKKIDIFYLVNLYNAIQSLQTSNSLLPLAEELDGQSKQKIKTWMDTNQFTGEYDLTIKSYKKRLDAERRKLISRINDYFIKYSPAP